MEIGNPLRVVLAALLFASASALAEAPASQPASTPSFELDTPAAKAPDDIVVLVAKPEDVENRHHQNLVKALFKDAPEGTRVRVIYRERYDPSPDKVITYLYSMVPLDPNGAPHGTEAFYPPWGGGTLREITYRYGVRHGPEKVYSRAERGAPYVQSEIPWKDGTVTGTQRTFYPDGKVQMETEVVDGTAQGPARSYDKDGKLTSECTMRDGRRDGAYTEYWPQNAQPRKVIQYDQGKVVGAMKEYYSNGQLKREVPFKDNTLHGKETNFDPQGNLTRVRYWENGKMVSEREMQ